MKRPTATQRFNRWFDKITDLRASCAEWSAFDYLHENKEVLKQAYKMGYEQAIRDAKRWPYLTTRIKNERYK